MSILDTGLRGQGDGDAPPPSDGRSPLAGEGPHRGLFAQVLHRLRPRIPRLAREELTEALTRQGGPDDAFSPGERSMLHNILRLREVRVEDVMIPRADIEAVEITATLGEVLRLFEKNGHSRMPVYGESLDDPRGMIHIRDLLAHITRSARPSPRPAEAAGEAKGRPDLRQINLSRRIDELRLVRKVLFVPPSMLASDLMARMQATRTQMALVIDEYGGTDGLVSLEDVIEMVVGDIADEHDDEAPMVTETADGVFAVDARADLVEVRRIVGEDFDIAAFENEADTIGGLLFSELGRVPARGEVVQAVPGFEFQVLDADPRRVRRVRIVRLRQGDRRRRVVQSLGEASAAG